MNFAFLGFLADGQQSTFKYFLNGSSLFLGELENIITVNLNLLVYQNDFLIF